MPMEKIASIHNKRRATAGNQSSILRFARPGSTRCMAANGMYVTKTGTSNDDTAIRPFSSTSVAVCRVTSVDPSGSNVPDVPWYVGASKNQTPTTQASPCAVHADTVVMRLAILGLLAVMGDNRHSATGRAGSACLITLAPPRRSGKNTVIHGSSSYCPLKETSGEPTTQRAVCGDEGVKQAPRDARVSCYLGITGSVIREGWAVSVRYLAVRCLESATAATKSASAAGNKAMP